MHLLAWRLGEHDRVAGHPVASDVAGDSLLNEMKQFKSNIRLLKENQERLEYVYLADKMSCFIFLTKSDKSFLFSVLLISPAQLQDLVSATDQDKARSTRENPQE